MISTWSNSTSAFEQVQSISTHCCGAGKKVRPSAWKFWDLLHVCKQSGCYIWIYINLKYTISIYIKFCFSQYGWFRDSTKSPVSRCIYHLSRKKYTQYIRHQPFRTQRCAGWAWETAGFWTQGCWRLTGSSKVLQPLWVEISWIYPFSSGKLRFRLGISNLA